MSLVENAIRRIQAGKGGQARASNAPRVARATPRAGEPAAQGPLIAIDRQVLRDAGLLPPESQESRIADQYRLIKRPLIDRATGREAPAPENAHVIMVSSAVPGDGKTFTSINLALSIAREKDVSVLLIDADVVKPNISRVLGVEGRPGLLEALRDDTIDVRELTLQTDVPNLCFLPVGSRSEDDTELLSSQRMLEVTAQLEVPPRHRIVVIDTPPLLLTSESLAISRHAGQIVLVVNAGRTSYKELAHAVGLLDPDKPIGFVLNNSLQKAEAPYNYGSYGTPDARTQS